MSGVLITTDISGNQQEHNFMNATLSSHGDVAVSIAIEPAIPEGIETEEEIAAYLREELTPLTQLGWRVKIQIGPDE